MTLNEVYELILSNPISSSVFTFIVIAFFVAMLMMPFYVFRIHMLLGKVIKHQEDAKKRALKDRELRSLPKGNFDV